MRSTTTRRLRENLSETMERVAKGEEILVTRRGVPYVRMLSAVPRVGASSRYPLRGSVVRVADDFDAPLTDHWAALSK